MDDWKRRKYTEAEQNAIISLYDQHKYKPAAMRAINSISGFEHVYERKIRRWKSRTKPAGRPVSDEFESEVMEVYSQQMYFISPKSPYPYAALKESAMKVFNKEYWDERSSTYVKKWQLDKHTCHLQFTSKWVVGMLRRVERKAAAAATVHVNACYLNKTGCPEASVTNADSLCFGQDSCEMDSLFSELLDVIDELSIPGPENC